MVKYSSYFLRIFQRWRLGRKEDNDDDEKAIESSGPTNVPSPPLSPSSEDALARQQTHNHDNNTPEAEETNQNIPASLGRQSSAETDNGLPKVHQIKKKRLHFWEGGVRPRHRKIVRFIGRCGFIAKGMVYGVIGVLIATTITNTSTPNGSQGNESPQGVFLLLGGIPAVGRSVLVAMAVGLATYLVWRFWEGITGQGEDATKGRKGNFFKYRLSPIVSGGVYTAYLYYVVQMTFQTEDEQQKTASSSEFPASWTSSVVGSIFVGIFGLAFFIALITQLVNAITGNFIPDLKTSAPDARRWEAIIVHTSGRIGFAARGVVFGTLSGFFWESLAKRNVSGNSSVVGAAINKLANRSGGKFFLMVIAIGLIIYALFAISNAYYKYFPTPPPSRIPLYIVEDEGPAWWSKILKFRIRKAKEEKEGEEKQEAQKRQHSIRQYLRIPRALRPARNVPPPTDSAA